MENRSAAQPEQTKEFEAQMFSPSALGATTLLFILGFAIGSGRFRPLVKRGGRVLTALGMVAFDRLTSLPLFDEQTNP